MDLSFFTFDRDLFAINPNGLGAYLDPVGAADVHQMARPNKRSFELRCPNTFELVRKLTGQNLETKLWGRQLDNGNWRSYRSGHVGKTINRKDGRIVQVYDKPLEEFNLLKHLTGRQLSLGTTDRQYYDAYEILVKHRRINQVGSLRIDVDMDEIWAEGRHKQLLTELRCQQEIVEAMGLKYQVFCTGGRGVQLMIPLPCPLEPVMASFLSRGLRRALRWRPNTCFVKVDRDGFDGLMRLPAGVHRSGRTSMFIDVANERLYDIKTQSIITATCLSPLDHKDLAQIVLDAQTKLIPRLRAIGLLDFESVSERQIDEIVALDPSNLICKMIRAAEDAAGISIPTRSRNESPEAMNRRPLSHCDRSWATGVWQRDIEPGHFWDWIRMGEGRGMLAAVCLFGVNGALGRLHQKVDEIEARDYKNQRQRHSTIDSLWRAFKFKDFRPGQSSCTVAVPTLIPKDTQDLAVALASRVKELCPTSKWPVARAIAILEVMFLAIGSSAEGEVLFSHKDIATLVNERMGEGYTNENRVNDFLKLICLDSFPTDDDDDDSMPLLEVFTRVRAARHLGAKSTYFPGKGLLETPLGLKFIEMPTVA